MARISVFRLFVLCVALGACATIPASQRPRVDLQWQGDVMTLTVENPHPHPIVIEEYRDDGMNGVPHGMVMRVRDSSGRRLAYHGADRGEWYTPWLNSSAGYRAEYVRMAPGERFQSTFSAADMALMLRIRRQIETERCRYQIRVRISYPDSRLVTAYTGAWREIDCDALPIAYCPLDEEGVFVCAGEPAVVVRRE